MSNPQRDGEDQTKAVPHKFSEIFGENIFSLNNLKEYVTEPTYEKIRVYQIYTDRESRVH